MRKKPICILLLAILFIFVTAGISVAGDDDDDRPQQIITKQDINLSKKKCRKLGGEATKNYTYMGSEYKGKVCLFELNPGAGVALCNKKWKKCKWHPLKIKVSRKTSAPAATQAPSARDGINQSKSLLGRQDFAKQKKDSALSTAESTSAISSTKKRNMRDIPSKVPGALDRIGGVKVVPAMKPDLIIKGHTLCVERKPGTTEWHDNLRVTVKNIGRAPSYTFAFLIICCKGWYNIGGGGRILKPGESHEFVMVKVLPRFHENGTGFDFHVYETVGGVDAQGKSYLGALGEYSPDSVGDLNWHNNRYIGNCNSRTFTDETPAQRARDTIIIK